VETRDSNSGITVSAVVCTHNGGDVIEKAITSLQKQDYPDDLYEILVVNNASTDDTPAIIEKLSSAGPKEIRCVDEPKLGLSNARNAGIQASQSEVIAFIDDDSMADEKWLSSLVQIFQQHDAACVGGKVNPIWSIPPPSWLPEEIQLYLTIVDMGPEIRELHGLEYPSGTNISYRKTAVQEVGGFDPRFGRTGSLLLSGEEDDLCQRLEAAGHKRYYNPSAIVNNPIPESRLTKKWFISRGYWQGRTSALRGGTPIYIGEDLVAPTLFSFLRCTWDLITATAKGNAKGRFQSRFSLAYIWGVFMGRLKGLFGG
jgi:glycosyltransferase involved in cell wall biosynthesis